MATITEIARPAPAHWHRAASFLGIPDREYVTNRAAGRRWCTHCRGWHPSSTPFVGNTSICKRRWHEYRQALAEKRRSA